MRFKPTGVLLALLAVLAMSAVAASAASAKLPEFLPHTKAPFTSKIGSFHLENKLGEHPLECTGGKTVGEIVNATQVGKVVVTFTGCRYPGLGGECNTSGKSSGEVVTNALKGELGETGKTVVLGLEPEKAGAAVAVYSCGGLDVTMKGGLIGAITPIEKEQTTFKQVWEQSGGQQRIKSFEGSSTKTTRSLHLELERNGKAAEEAGAEGVEELTFKELVEVT